MVIIGGPNGAGKSTIAPEVLRDLLGVTTFVNADVIAQGLCAFDPESVAIEAGRFMLARLKELADQRHSFAFETTLASRTFAPWLAELKSRVGYRVHLVYAWLPSADAAVERVRNRVRRGGHAVPDEVVRRRFERSLHNLFDLYLPLADAWHIYDSSQTPAARVAFRAIGRKIKIVQSDRWEEIQESAR